MKNLKKTIAKAFPTVIVLSLIFILTSCSKDDDDNAPLAAVNYVSLPNNLLKTYTGILVYNPASGNEIIDVISGTATISGNSSNYTISFNNGVPNLTNIRFVLINGQYIHAASNDSDEGIVLRDLDEDQLTIGISKNSNSWEFTSQFN